MFTLPEVFLISLKCQAPLVCPESGSFKNNNQNCSCCGTIQNYVFWLFNMNFFGGGGGKSCFANFYCRTDFSIVLGQKSTVGSITLRWGNCLKGPLWKKANIRRVKIILPCNELWLKRSFNDGLHMDASFKHWYKD